MIIIVIVAALVAGIGFIGRMSSPDKARETPERPLTTDSVPQPRAFSPEPNITDARSNVTVPACLQYSPESVTVSGVMTAHIFPGRPNYESVANGDEPENVWLLNLDAPACTAGGAADSPPESNVRHMQLLISDQDDYNRFRPLLGGRVKVTGSLSHGYTGHHHTSVMLEVKDIE